MTSWLLHHWDLPCHKEYNHRHLEQRSLWHLFHHLCLSWKGQCPSTPGSSTKEATTTTPGFSPQAPEDLILPAWEGAYLPGASALFDPSTLELLEMNVLHTPATGKVHYCLEAWSLARITLPDTSTWRYLGPSPRDEEDWANTSPKYELM